MEVLKLLTIIIIILVIFVLIILIIYHYIDGYYALNFVNKILKKYENKQAVYPTDKQWCKDLRDNYKVIRDEYINYTSTYKLKRACDLDYTQRQIDTGEIPWEILILKLYNKDTDKIFFFPKTYNLIKNIPECKSALFSILKPGKKLDIHHGPSNLLLRYHLSLIVPNNNEYEGLTNLNKKCFLTVDNKKHFWKEGTDIIFDDTYLHTAENNTDTSRVVLILDIKKKYDNIFLDFINDIFLYFSKYNSTVIDIVKNVNNS